MGFVVSDDGSIKMLRKKYWGELVRTISMDGIEVLPTDGPEPLHTRAKSSCKQSMRHAKDCWIPPSIISFVPDSDEDHYSLFPHDTW